MEDIRQLDQYIKANEDKIKELTLYTDLLWNEKAKRIKSILHFQFAYGEVDRKTAQRWIYKITNESGMETSYDDTRQIIIQGYDRIGYEIPIVIKGNEYMLNIPDYRNITVESVKNNNSACRFYISKKEGIVTTILKYSYKIEDVIMYIKNEL